MDDTTYSLYGYWNYCHQPQSNHPYRHNLLAIWVLKQRRQRVYRQRRCDTTYSLYGYWNTNNRRRESRLNKTQPTRYMGIETLYIINDVWWYEDTTYSLYGYWNSFFFMKFTTNHDTTYSLYGYWNIFANIKAKQWRGHNLLAIWVLKRGWHKTYTVDGRTQPTRYMGIETFATKRMNRPTRTQPTRYMGIETRKAICMWLWILTQPTRYMGIETWRLVLLALVVPGHNLLAIWVLKHFYFWHSDALLNRHNLLAIWVLKLKNFLICQ